MCLDDYEEIDQALVDAMPAKDRIKWLFEQLSSTTNPVIAAIRFKQAGDDAVVRSAAIEFIKNTIRDWTPQKSLASPAAAGESMALLLMADRYWKSPEDITLAVLEHPDPSQELLDWARRYMFRAFGELDFRRSCAGTGASTSTPIVEITNTTPYELHSEFAEALGRGGSYSTLRWLERYFTSEFLADHFGIVAALPEYVRRGHIAAATGLLDAISDPDIVEEFQTDEIRDQAWKARPPTDSRTHRLLGYKPSQLLLFALQYPNPEVDPALRQKMLDLLCSMAIVDPEQISDKLWPNRFYVLRCLDAAKASGDPVCDKWILDNACELAIYSKAMKGVSGTDIIAMAAATAASI